MAKFQLICILLISLLLIGTAQAGEPVAASGRLLGSSTWHGTVELTDSLVVPAGAELRILPGTRIIIHADKAGIQVHGSLRVEGTAELPVQFQAGPDWKGVELHESPEASSFSHVHFKGGAPAISASVAVFSVRHCEFRDCRIAIKLLRKSDPKIETSFFAANSIGIDNETQSSPLIRNNHFERHTTSAIFASHGSRGSIVGNHFVANKAAVILEQSYPEQIAGNHFVKNGTAVRCAKTGHAPLITGNNFEQNETGLLNLSNSAPRVEHNQFLRNGIALSNERFASPEVIHNLLVENRTAIRSCRRSAPQIHRNVFQKNRVAVFCDYSSYPHVSENNFVGNELSVELGRNQSADWDRRGGIQRARQEQRQAKVGPQGSSRPQLDAADQGHVDLRNNWWGELTAEMKQRAEGDNLPAFYDRHDLPRVTFPEAAGESYDLDVVVYHPPLPAPVGDAGPQVTSAP